MATSRLGEGSCFTFSATLPIPDKASITEASTESLKISRELSILLVDDNPINLLAARTLLNQEGHKVVEAENGKDAIEKLNSQTFDVILMDVHMPVMDGVSAAREIRKGNDKVKDIPIVGVTASVMSEETEGYLRAGMNAVVAKPIEVKKLMNVISDLL